MITKKDIEFLKLAREASKKSTCFRKDRQIGAVYVKDGIVLADGANSVPEGISSCKERKECIRKSRNITSGTRLEICYANCAEMVAMIKALKSQKDLTGSTLYCTHRPCSRCARMIIAAGIEKVIFENDYPDEFSKILFDKAGVELIKGEIK